MIIQDYVIVDVDETNEQIKNHFENFDDAMDCYDNYNKKTKVVEIRLDQYNESGDLIFSQLL